MLEGLNPGVIELALRAPAASATPEEGRGETRNWSAWIVAVMPGSQDANTAGI